MKDKFSGFPYAAGRLRKYFYNLNFFMFLLDTGEYFAYTAENRDSLLLWLKENQVPDIRDLAE